MLITILFETKYLVLKVSYIKFPCSDTTSAFLCTVKAIKQYIIAHFISSGLKGLTSDFFCESWSHISKSNHVIFYLRAGAANLQGSQSRFPQYQLYIRVCGMLLEVITNTLVCISNS